MSQKFYCDICEKECLPSTLRIEVSRHGIVNGKCNETELMEDRSFDICDKCVDKIKSQENKLTVFIDMIMDGIGKLK